MSPRARRVRLRVTPEDGLVVVVPPRFPRSRIAGIVRDRAAWVETALAEAQRRRDERRSASGDAGPGTVPEAVDLLAIGERWRVERRPASGTGVRARLADGVAVLTGAVDDAEACRAALRRLLAARARVALPDLARRLAAEQDLEPSRVSVRAQRSRWGSCSRRGAISLNRALLFLPPDLAEHVVLHELVHLVRLDHSAAFHAELTRRDPRTPTHRAALRESWRHVPEWATESPPPQRMD